MPRPRYSRACECGCGEYTQGGRFRPGHDAKLKGNLLRIARDPQSSTYLRDWAIGELTRLGWLHFYLYQPQTVRSSTPRVFDPAKRKFGVEIEFLHNGRTGSEIVEALRATGLQAAYESYNHRTRRHWKLTTDGSLQGAGFELVSPVLSGKAGMQQLKKACQALANMGCKIDRRCGLHVHHEIRDLTVQDVARVVRSYTNNQGSINGFLAPSRRHNEYCMPWSDSDFSRLDNIAAMNQIHEGTFSRRLAVNLSSFPRYGTMEFRQHQGSIEFEKISKWIEFTRSLINESITQQAVFADWREWAQDHDLRSYIVERQRQFYNRAQTVAV